MAPKKKAAASGFSSSDVGNAFSSHSVGDTKKSKKQEKEELDIVEEVIEEEVVEEVEEVEEKEEKPKKKGRALKKKAKKEEKEVEDSKDSKDAEAAEDADDSEEKEQSDKKKPKGRSLFKRKKKEVEEESEEGEEEEEEDKKGKKKKKAKKKVVVKSGKKTGLSGALERLNNVGMGKQANQFIQGMATMMNAGVPLLDAIDIYALEVRSRPMKKVMYRMKESVEQGTPFWQAMEDLNLFTQYDIAMVQIGEEAGNLARNIEYLAEQKEKDRALKQKVKMAMVYPAIVMVMMFIIVMGLGMFVLPNLVQVLFSLNVELPASTRAVIYVSNMFSKHGAIFVPSLIGAMIVFALLAKFTRFKVVSQWMIFHIPGIGGLAKYATIARFGVILGGLLRAGVPLMEALSSLVNVTQVVAYKKFYARLHDQLLLGDSFSKVFKSTKGSQKILPISVQSLVVTGEKSGSLSKSLLKIAEIYEKKASETAEALPTILEPMLLLFVGGLVGTIAFAIIVPIYSVVGNVGG